MVLVGKLSTELGIKSPGAKFYNLFATQIHDAQHMCDRVHETKLHEGEDWHHPDSVKHWTYVIDGEVHTCQERIISNDDESQTIKYDLFGGDINPNYKTFNLILQVIENSDGSGGDAIKWTIEYEKHHEDHEPPHGWMDYLNKCTRDIDANLLKA